MEERKDAVPSLHVSLSENPRRDEVMQPRLRARLSASPAMGFVGGKYGGQRRLRSVIGVASGRVLREAICVYASSALD
jgi:hypothetical protein